MTQCQTDMWLIQHSLSTFLFPNRAKMVISERKAELFFWYQGCWLCSPTNTVGGGNQKRLWLEVDLGIGRWSPLALPGRLSPCLLASRIAAASQRLDPSPWRERGRCQPPMVGETGLIIICLDWFLKLKSQRSDLCGSKKN